MSDYQILHLVMMLLQLLLTVIGICESINHKKVSNRSRTRNGCCFHSNT